MLNFHRDSILHRADKIVRASGLRKYFCLWALGAIAALAMPPLYFFPGILIGYAALYVLLARSGSAREAAWMGFFFHLGYFMIGLYWINAALLVDLSFAWMIPLCAIGLPALLSLYGALLGGATKLTAKKYSFGTMPHAFCFVALFFLCEWIRGHALTGFPWNLTGYGFGFSDYLVQTASIVGAYGLGAIVAFFSVALACWVLGCKRLLAASGVLLIAMAAFGVWRLPAAAMDTVPDVRLRLVQGNIAQELKWDHKSIQKNFYKYLDLSTLPAAKPPTHIIWPETAVSFLLDKNPEAMAAIQEIVPVNGAVILGAPRVDYADPSSPDPEIKNIYNSILGIDSNRTILFSYDKSHLVPFGEYVPLPGWFGIKKLVSGIFDYTPGPGPQTVTIDGLPPFSPLICYEIIFPGRVTDGTGRAKWLLNLTNDGWYGNTAGPYQHLAEARMRAVEEGLPIVRVANTGISAVIDPYGRTVDQLPLGQGGILDISLPQSLPTATFYTKVIK
ncbi:MAG: apolipoprotein N-acyltransferase [Alphaproteobacteria bacterium]|nr:MAG: apolipoprotein N-acyltransferase [Alphaproteobacteria bacterium]